MSKMTCTFVAVQSRQRGVPQHAYHEISPIPTVPDHIDDQSNPARRRHSAPNTRGTVRGVGVIMMGQAPAIGGAECQDPRRLIERGGQTPFRTSTSSMAEPQNRLDSSDGSDRTARAQPPV